MKCDTVQAGPVYHRPHGRAPSTENRTESLRADSRLPAPSGLRTELRHLRAPDGLTETGTGRDTRTSLSAGTAPVWQLTPRQGHRARSESQICTVRGLAPRGPDRLALYCVHRTRARQHRSAQGPPLSLLPSARLAPGTDGEARPRPIFGFRVELSPRPLLLRPLVRPAAERPRGRPRGRLA